MPEAPTNREAARRFYRLENVIVATGICVVGGITFAMMANDGSGAVLVWSLSLLYFIGAVRALAMRLTIGDEFVTVRNFFRTYRWPVAQVAGIVHSRYRLGGFPSVAIRLEDGRTHSITALAPPNPGLRPNHEPTANIVLVADRELSQVKQQRRRHDPSG